MLTTAKLQLSSMTIVKHDVGYGIGAYCELGFHMLLICSIFVNVDRIIFMSYLLFYITQKLEIIQISTNYHDVLELQVII